MRGLLHIKPDTIYTTSGLSSEPLNRYFCVDDNACDLNYFQLTLSSNLHPHIPHIPTGTLKKFELTIIMDTLNININS